MNLKSIIGAALLVYGALSAIGAGSAQASEGATEPARPLTTIASLDVQRYLGTWYEIAKYPNQFQKKCAAATRADYSQLANGRLSVVNRCTTQDGLTSEAIGEARQTGSATSPKLQVRFAPAWLSFIPMVWGNYWVIDLDPNYQVAAISEPTREYLWVLARSPEISPKTYADLTARLEKMGFDLQKLVRTPHAK